MYYRWMSFSPSPKAPCGDDSALGDLREAATKLMEALNSLSQQVKEGVWVGQDDEAAAAIPAATERLFRLGGSHYTPT